MWFKNLRVYKFTQDFQLPDNFQDALNERCFKPCSSTEPLSLGWVPVIRHSEEHALIHQNAVLLCLRKEEKVMPASAVNSELERHKEAFEQEHARPMPRKEQSALKEEIVHGLLPRALSRFSVTWGMIDLAQQRVLVDTSSATRAEEFTAQLRSCLGSLPVRPWGPEYPASQCLTQWVKQGAATAPFELGEDAEFKSSQEEGMVVRLRRHDLCLPEVTQHLEHQKQVTELGLIWPDRLSFLLSDDYGIKRIKFADVIVEQRQNDQTDSAAAQLDADFALMSREFAELLNTLEQALTEPNND